MPAPLDASQHDTANCPGVPLRVIGRLDPPAFCVDAKERWHAAAAAASALYRAHDARTATDASALLYIAHERLMQAGLIGLGEIAGSLSEDFAAPLQAVCELQDRVAEAAGKLEAAYLEMTDG